MQKNYCLECKAEVTGDTKTCECGGRSFVFGDLKITDGEVTCECGCKEIKITCHMDCTDKYLNSGACVKCGKPIGIETYRTGEDALWWE